MYTLYYIFHIILPSIFYQYIYFSPHLTSCPCIFVPQKILQVIFTLTPSKMDNLHTSYSSCERLPAEEVRKFLGLNDDFSNSSSSSSSDCEPDISYLSSDISGTQSESEMEQIIPPSPKRIKTTRKNQKTKFNLFHKKETCEGTDVSTTLCNPLEHDMIHQQTSGNNHSVPSPLYMVQESAYNVTQTDTPSKNNHAEVNILPTEVDDHPVPEPVFTLDLDVEASHQDFVSK